ncbi:MAG: biotin--[acetyl-CoA-carboxylase] ligase [Azospirillaceae bacterium]
MTAAPRWTVHRIDSVGSSNDALAAMAADGAPAGSVLIARRQTAGRGRRGRPWVSEDGNLHLSLLVQPARPLAEWGSLALVCGLAATTALRRLAGRRDICVKWPNDVLAGPAKLAGILPETVGAGPAGLVVGFGVNLAHHPEDGERPATSLAALGHAAIVPEAMAEALLADLAPLLDRWEAEGFAALRPLWIASAIGLGRPVTVNLSRERFAGVLEDVDARGIAVIRVEDGGRRSVAAGEIFFPPDAGTRGG